MNVTCECGNGPREVVEHEDDAGVKRWTLANLCTDCLTRDAEADFRDQWVNVRGEPCGMYGGGA